MNKKQVVVLLLVIAIVFSVISIVLSVVSFLNVENSLNDNCADGSCAGNSASTGQIGLTIVKGADA